MTNKGFIICVDDEQSVLNQLSGQLDLKFGDSNEIEIAESAEEAMELVDDLIEDGETIELIICDQIMPGMKGANFLEKINSKYPEIGKILLTGQAGLESAIYAINKANLDKYVEKPWEIENLALTIKTLTTQFRMRQQILIYNKQLEQKNKNLETLHQIGIKLHNIYDTEILSQEVIKACANLALNDEIVFFYASGIDRKPPVAAESVQTELVNSLWKHFSTSLEDALESGIPLNIDHSAPSDFIDEPLTPIFPNLKFSLWIPVATNDKFLGSICLFFNQPTDKELISTLSILANQFASTLFNLELTSEKIKSERLATIGQMISSIIHDFKNPMTTIKGLVGLMGDSDFSAEDRKTYSDMVIEEVDRVVGMVNELLEFSRGGRGEFRKTDVLFKDLMLKISNVYEKEFEDKGITLEKEFNYDGMIQLDIEKIKRSFFNIIDNARDAMTDKGGKLSITANNENDSVEIIISDNGPGMPPEVKNHIFEPFVTHGKIHGTGLGMAITKKIIDDHKGFIALESEPGKGTTFTIRLPLK